MNRHVLLALIAVLSSAAGSHAALAANSTPSVPTSYVCANGLLGTPFLQTAACMQPAQLTGTVFAAHVKGSTGSLAPSIDIGSNWLQVGTHRIADQNSTYDTTLNFATAFRTTPVCTVSADYPSQQAGLAYGYAAIISTSTVHVVVANSIDSDTDYVTALSGASFTIICTTGQ